MLAAALGGALLPPAKVRAGLAAFDREYDRWGWLVALVLTLS
jgi:hypothetical protein